MKKRVAYLGVFCALALIFSYVESLIPFFFGVPGMKLGLANSLIVIILYTVGAKSAIAINIIRVLLAGFMFGNVFSICYSLAGCLLSFAAMLILESTSKLGVVAVSTIGGIFHNLGQLLVAMAVLNTISLLYYFSVLLISGFVTGFLIGILSLNIIKRIKGKL